MANEYGTAVLFAKEKNTWFLSARITFDANGAPALDTTQSKGFCAIWQNTPTFTAGTNGSSSVLGSVSSFQGLFSGMNLTIASSLAIITTATIGSITPTLATSKTFKVTAANNAQNGWPQFDTPSVTFVAGSGGGGTGQYVLQFGQQAASRLQTYNKVLAVDYVFDMTTGSTTGSASQMQLSPVAPNFLWIRNQTRLRTIPQVATSGSTDATITFQLGTGTGQNFVAGVPAPGEALIINVIMGNSTAP